MPLDHAGLVRRNDAIVVDISTELGEGKREKTFTVEMSHRMGDPEIKELFTHLPRAHLLPSGESVLRAEDTEASLTSCLACNVCFSSKEVK